MEIVTVLERTILKSKQAAVDQRISGWYSMYFEWPRLLRMRLLRMPC